MTPDDDAPELCSYVNLRRLIGVLSISLPLLCLTGLVITATELQSSISHCYFTNVRDVLVGVTIGISMFLITYRGYALIDNVITNITGIAGIALALCPCLCSYTNPELNLPAGYFNIDPHVSSGIHLVSSVIFFLLLAFNSMFLFTKTDPERAVTANKRKRNVVYIVCGLVMVVSMAIFAAFFLSMGKEKFDEVPIAFFLESLMLLAFGTSWLVKGETIFRD